VKVHLEMGAHMEPDADSGDVIGEIPGREKPEEVVVIGGHIDSWDVGQGAQDDGASIMACLQALALMNKLGLQPRRTIRVAFWVNEENGGRGADAYRAFVGDRIRTTWPPSKWTAGPKRRSGSAPAPTRIHLRCSNRLDRCSTASAPARSPAEEEARISARSSSMECPPFRAHRGHALLRLASLRGGYARQGGPQDFRKNMAALAVMGYVLADMPARITAGGGGRRGR